jgi:hypothetical protein
MRKIKGIMASSETFEAMNKKALEIAEEEVRRVMFGCTPDPQFEEVRQTIIYHCADRIMERWVDTAVAEGNRRDKT